jgi:hypothetical protein
MSLRPKDVTFFLLLVFIITPIWLILAAGVGAAIVEHILDPGLKKKTNADVSSLVIAFTAILLFPFWIIRKWRKRLRAGRGVGSRGGPIVLYLRPFSSDQSVSSEYYSWFFGWWGRPSRPAHSIEFGFQRVFGRLGRLVAIGRPEELVSRDGASRFYPSDAEWQASVVRALKIARSVIIVAGTTRGVQWELEQIRRHVAPRRVLVMLPESSLADRRQMVAIMANAFGVDFAKLTDTVLAKNRPLFFAFNESWTVLGINATYKSIGILFGRIPVTRTVIDFDASFSDLVQRIESLDALMPEM